jgi:putative ABC transport system ATP-binding protein
VLSLTAVGKTFPGSPPVHALRAATFRVHPGEVLGIVGRSGSGKSTLLNVLGLLDVHTTGNYCVHGQDVSALSDRHRTALRAHFFAFIFQQSFLLADRTARENVEIALRLQPLTRRERRDRAAAALERVGLANRSAFLPHTLSGGESQRVAIARAIASEPRVLLCDEPTGNLDERTTAEVVDLLLGAQATGAAVIIVTHDLVIARSLPRLLSVRDGHVTEGAESFLATATDQNMLA